MFQGKGKYLDDPVHIGFRGGLIQADAHSAVGEIAEVDLPFQGVGADLFCLYSPGKDDLQRVEKVRVVLPVPHLGEFCRQGAGL